MDNKINRTYKDSLFCRLFDSEKSKESLLSLYNAMNGTSYTDLDALECMTIENVIFMGMKNDVAFLIDSQLNLYEHQSTYNPNMPLRGLKYYSQLYEGHLAKYDIKLYGSQLVKIPTPRYSVFYNGTEHQEDIVKLRLSDAFEVADDSGDFQWTATMININVGHNKGLMESCQTLHDYAVLIGLIRSYTEKCCSLEEAVLLAVNECIEKEILSDFLKVHKAEVTGMILTEYNEQEARDCIRKESESIGIKKGKDIGKLEAALKFKGKGLSDDLIAETLDIPLETVKNL